MTTTERRCTEQHFEVRARGRRLEGYAALFDKKAKLGHFIETIKPGAFTGSLARGSDVVALVDTDAGRVLARTRNQTLRLSEDSKGLTFDLDLPATSYANDVLALVERRDIGGMSFGFTVDEGGDTWAANWRELRAVTLHEISVVSCWPAYEGTIVNARAKAPAPALTRSASSKPFSADVLNNAARKLAAREQGIAPATPSSETARLALARAYLETLR